MNASEITTQRPKNAIVILLDSLNRHWDYQRGHESEPCEPLGHTPLFVAMPGVVAGKIDALTTNVDICATLA